MPALSKRERILRDGGANIDESIGVRSNGKPAGQAAAAHPESERWRGVDRSKVVIRDVPIERLAPDPKQPRREFDEESIAELAESLKKRGQLHPAMVRWDEAKKWYVIIAGERRLRAARVAGWKHLTCRICDGLSNREIRLMQLVENCAREDLAPMDLARSLREVLDESGWSQAQLSEEVGLSKSAISRALELLDVAKPVQRLVESGELAPSTAREIAKIESKTDQTRLAKEAVREGLTREQVQARFPAMEPKGFDYGSKSGSPLTRSIDALHGATSTLADDSMLQIATSKSADLSKPAAPKPVKAEVPVVELSYDVGDGCEVIVITKGIVPPSHALHRAMLLAENDEQGVGKFTPFLPIVVNAPGDQWHNRAGRVSPMHDGSTKKVWVQIQGEGSTPVALSFPPEKLLIARHEVKGGNGKNGGRK